MLRESGVPVSVKKQSEKKRLGKKHRKPTPQGKPAGRRKSDNRGLKPIAGPNPEGKRTEAKRTHEADRQRGAAGHAPDGGKSKPAGKAATRKATTARVAANKQARKLAVKPVNEQSKKGKPKVSPQAAAEAAELQARSRTRREPDFDEWELAEAARLTTDISDIPNADLPLIAICGRPNVGKSTLFNRLTAADVVAADQLFATLDPTMRQLRLPHGGRVILSDTVGFISDLPTGLISAFRATLEEVVNADIILHVRDMASPDSAMQEADVETVLAELGLTRAQGPRRIEVLNKIDLLSEARRAALLQLDQREPSVAISALDGQGCGQLLERIETMLAADYVLRQVRLKPDDGANLTWLYRNADVLQRIDDADGMVQLEVRMSTQSEARFKARMAPG